MDGWRVLGKRINENNKHQLYASDLFKDLSLKNNISKFNKQNPTCLSYMCITVCSVLWQVQEYRPFLQAILVVKEIRHI